jgi:glycosyl transferase-like sugar-binding protein
VACLRPRIVHFIFGLRPQVEPFHLLHYLAIASCRQVVQPDEIQLHVHELPYGFYWDLARPMVSLHRVAPVEEVGNQPFSALLEPYRYAHHADVIRLDLLDRHGGMYADIDTLFVQPVPQEFWSMDAVIGRESAVVYPDSSGPEESVSNALMLARPQSDFIALWRRQIVAAMDGTWSGHSCRLAMRLANQHPEFVHVAPQAAFSPFDHTPEGLRSLLEAPSAGLALPGTFSVHLCAHLWWDTGRRDFSSVAAAHITERYIRTHETTLAQLARPFLPSHGLF